MCCGSPAFSSSFRRSSATCVSTVRKRSGGLTGALIFLVAGVSHFVIPAAFESIVPKWVPDAHAVVFWSCIAEIVGAIGLLIPQTRVAATWSLIVLLLAVFPANVQMLLNAGETNAPTMYVALLWMRLPLQPLLIWWVWKAAIVRRAKADR